MKNKSLSNQVSIEHRWTLHETICSFVEIISTSVKQKMTQNVPQVEVWYQLSTTIGPCGPSEVPRGVYVCHNVVSFARCVSRGTSFEKGFSRTILDSTSVPTFCPSPSVGGWYIHPLSGTMFVNDMAWTREGMCPDRTYMDGCSRCLGDMINTWVSSQQTYSRKSRWSSYVKTWNDTRYMGNVVGNSDDDEMQCCVMRDFGLKQKEG